MANNEETHSTETSSQIVEQSQIEEQPQRAEQSQSRNNGSGKGKGVTVLLSSDVAGEVVILDNEKMAKIKKPESGRFKNCINFTSEMSAKDVEKALLDEFDILKNHRFCCAKLIDKRTRLEFDGERRVWDGLTIRRNIKGNSALYILIEDEGTSRESQPSTSGLTEQQMFITSASESCIVPKSSNMVVSNPASQQGMAGKRKVETTAKQEQNGSSSGKHQKVNSVPELEQQMPPVLYVLQPAQGSSQQYCLPAPVAEQKENCITPLQGGQMEKQSPLGKSVVVASLQGSSQSYLPLQLWAVPGKQGMVYLAPQGGSLQTAGSQKLFKGTLNTHSYPSKSGSQVPVTGHASPSMQTTNNCSSQVSDVDFQPSAEGNQRKGSTSTQTATLHLGQQSAVDLPTGNAVADLRFNNTIGQTTGMDYLVLHGGSLQSAGSQNFFEGTLDTDSYPSKSVLQVPVTGLASPSMQTANNCSRQISYVDFQPSTKGNQRKGSTSTQTATVHLGQQSAVDLPTGNAVADLQFPNTIDQTTGMVYLVPQGGSLQTAGSQKCFEGTLDTNSYPSKSGSQVPMIGQASPPMQTSNKCSRQVSYVDFQTSAEGNQRKESTSTQTATMHLSSQSAVALPTGNAVADLRFNNTICQTTAAQDSVKPVSMASGSQQGEFIDQMSEQECLNDHNHQENLVLDQLLLDIMSSGDNSDTGYESTFPGESTCTDTEQSEDAVPVAKIIPNKGSTKGGDEFCVILPCMVPLHIQSCVAHFEGCGTVPLVAYSFNTLTGITPGSKNPGFVNVTVMSKDESWIGGKTKFLYVDRFTRKELLLQLLKESELQSKMCECMHKGITSDLQTSDPSGKALPGSSGVNHSRHAQSVKLLQFLVYKAAQFGGDEFIQMIFSTSAGRVVFNNYKNNAKLPEHVARANGHKILAEYLQDVNNRLSEESNSDSGTETIDWLELKRFVDKEESLPCTEEEQMLKNCQPPSAKSDYDGSDYLADDELSACSSPSHSELSDTEHEDHSQETITYRSLKKEKEKKLQVESLFPLHFVGNQLNVIPSIKAEEDAYEHKQLNSVEVESHSSEGNHDETAHDEIEASINPWKECIRKRLMDHAISEGEAEDSATESMWEIGTNVDNKDIVTKICPNKGSIKGGDQFHFILRDFVPKEISSCKAIFQGCGEVYLEKTSASTLAGITPGSRHGPGKVRVTLISSDGSWLGGESDFLYIEDPPAEEEPLSNKVVRDSGMWGELFERMSKEMSTSKPSDGQTSDSSGNTAPEQEGNTDDILDPGNKVMEVLRHKPYERQKIPVRKKNLWNEDTIQENEAVTLLFSVWIHRLRKACCMTNVQEVKAARLENIVGRKSLLVPVNFYLIILFLIKLRALSVDRTVHDLAVTSWATFFA